MSEPERRPTREEFRAVFEMVCQLERRSRSKKDPKNSAGLTTTDIFDIIQRSHPGRRG